jgi:hypothetical protein
MLPRAEAITFLIYKSHVNTTLQYVFNVHNLCKMRLIQQQLVHLQLQMPRVKYLDTLAVSQPTDQCTSHHHGIMVLSYVFFF